MMSPVVEMGRPEGGLSVAEMEILRQHKPEIRACDDRELAHHPNAQGKTTALLTIDPNGSVSGVRLAGYPQTTLWSSFIEDCFVARIKAWLFPASDGGARPISLPYSLRTNP